MSERCDVIRAAFTIGMKEDAEKRLSLPQADPEAVHGVLYYLYTFCYPRDLKDRINRELLSHPAVTPHYWARPGKHFWLYDLEIYKVAHYLGLEFLANLAKEQLDQNCINPSSELFLSRLSGYVLLVDQLYPKPVEDEEQKGYDDKRMYVDLLKDTRKLLLASTSTLVAKNIKNEALNRLTQEISEFKQDVFSVLIEQNRRLALTRTQNAANSAFDAPTNGLAGASEW